MHSYEITSYPDSTITVQDQNCSISEIDCIQPEVDGNKNIPQASTNTYLLTVQIVVPDYS